MPILLYQRSHLAWLSLRRGAANSHNTTAANMPRRKLSLIAGSLALTNSEINPS